MGKYKPILGKKEKIFLTGHTGFKGTWLTLLLEELGHEVVGYSLGALPDSLYDRLGRSGLVDETIADIRDTHTLNIAMSAAKPSIIIHMAAQALVLESYRKPLETFEINAQGTANVLDAAFGVNTVSAIGMVTTDKVYKNSESKHSYVETDPLEGGSDPYSASKVAAEAVISGWKKIAEVSGGPAIVTLRSGNVIGGGDYSADRLIPDLVRSNLSGEEVIIRNPLSTRPWLHVLDSLAGYLLAIDDSKTKEKAEVYNFAPLDKSIAVREVLEIAIETWPGMFRHKIVENDIHRLEASLLDLNPSKAIRQLAWSTTWSQKNAVAASIEWWKKIRESELSVNEACTMEIHELLG